MLRLIRRQFRSFILGSVEGLAAIDLGSSVLAGFPSGVSLTGLRTVCPKVSGIRQVGKCLLATLPQDVHCFAEKPETDLFKGMAVLVAIRNGETAAATADWIDYHASNEGAEAALILDRDEPKGAFSDELDKLNPTLPTVVVTADRPLGLAGAPDARHPSLAPAAPKRISLPPDPWHAPLGEPIVVELMRHRFLAKARAVAFLDIGDIAMPDNDGPLFDRAAAAGGQVLLMHGVEAYPWRLRQDSPASHGDHIAVRREERRWLVSWCAVPGSLPQDAIWQPVRPMGATAADVRPVQFRRAMGVTFPGVPINELVRKSDLIEDSALVDLMPRAFKMQPIRLPRTSPIPPRPSSGRVTVVTAMKNEGPFLLDWIAHNRAIGIDRHLVYTNDCDDGTDRLLDLLGSAGVVRRDNPFRSTGQVPQFAAFRAAETEDCVTSADWLLTLDVDEYINIHAGDGRIEDMLAVLPKAHVISMPWRLFGNADRHTFQDKPVTKLHTRAAPPFAPRPLQAWAFKSLYRNTGLFRRLGVHRPKGMATQALDQIHWNDGSGRLLSPAKWRSAWRMSKTNWGYDLVSVNHYAVRNAESFLVKRDRGRVNHTSREQGLAYWFRMNHNAEEDTSIHRLS